MKPTSVASFSLRYADLGTERTFRQPVLKAPELAFPNRVISVILERMERFFRYFDSAEFPPSRRSRVLGSILLAHFTLACLSSARSDEVFVRSSDPKRTEPIRRVGVIAEFESGELTLTLPTGRNEKIPQTRVVDIKTEWSKSRVQGITAMEEGRWSEADNLFRKSKNEEERRWAIRDTMADLIECYRNLDQEDLAGEEFLALYASDPETRHFRLIPLEWRAGSIPPQRESKAELWTKDKSNPVARLLGASWLVCGSKRAAAESTLRELAKDIDVRIARLAEAQLWRLKTTGLKSNDASRWEKRLQEFPVELTPGPRLVIAEAHAKLGNHTDATIAFTRNAILFPTPRKFAILSWLGAARSFDQMEQKDEAARCYSEAKALFPSPSLLEEIEARTRDRK